MPKKEEEFNARAQKFLKVIQPLLKKHSIGITAIPCIKEDGKLGAQIQFVDTLKKDAN